MLIFTYLTASWVSEMALISQPFLCVFRWEMSADPAALKALVVASRHQTSGHQDIQTCCFWKDPWAQMLGKVSQGVCVQCRNFSMVQCRVFINSWHQGSAVICEEGFVMVCLLPSRPASDCFSKKLASKGVRTKAALRYFELVLPPRSSKQIIFEVGLGSKVKLESRNEEKCRKVQKVPFWITKQCR